MPIVFAPPYRLGRFIFMEGRIMPGKNRTVTMTYAALMTALAIILSYFPEIPLAFFAPWLKLDFSFTPLLLLGFSCGPVMLVVALLITNTVHILGGTTGMVGELANLIVGIAFLMPPTLLYRASRTRRSALIGMGIGSLLMVIAGVISNRYILLPTFFGSNFVEVMQGMGMTLKGYLFAAITPFNLNKALLNSAVAYFLYKRLSIILKEAEHDAEVHHKVKG
jgi:riboflavin transporter FmnP